MRGGARQNAIVARRTHSSSHTMACTARASLTARPVARPAQRRTRAAAVSADGRRAALLGAVTLGVGALAGKVRERERERGAGFVI